MRDLHYQWIRTPDGSFVDRTGRVLYFSTDRFIADICQGEACFICGRRYDSELFNDEHILPRWLLKRYDLFARGITLPNLTGFRYGQYTVRCCKDCNSLLGRRIEEPISELLAGGFCAVAKHVKEYGCQLLFLWIALIFLKTHLRDRKFRYHPDQRQSDSPIADLYDWAELHHVHCLVRSLYTGAAIEPEAFGSCLILQAKAEPLYEHFDYADLYQPQSVLLRVDDVAIFAVLNDSSAALSQFMSDVRKLTGPLSPLQLREVLAHLAYINVKLTERPEFRSSIDPDGTYRIKGAHPPQVVLAPHSEDEFGEIFYASTQDVVRRLHQANAAEMLAHIRGGRWTFLFDDEGRFIENSVIPAEPP